MATIDKRLRKNGYVYRVRVWAKDHPRFSLTFPSLSEAEEWINKHELAFQLDPGNYFMWKKRCNIEKYRGEIGKT